MTSFLTRRTDWGLLKAGLVTKTKLLVGFVFFKWHEAYTRVCFTLLLAATNWLHQDRGHSWRFQYNLTTRAWVLRTVSNLEVLLITSYFKTKAVTFAYHMKNAFSRCSLNFQFLLFDTGNSNENGFAGVPFIQFYKSERTFI